MNQRYFSSIVELSRDRGLIGKILKNYPEWIWRAADKDADYRKRHDNTGHLPLPDPWHFLMGLRDVPEWDKAVFRAAQSQLVALRHLGRIRMGIATLNTDWQQEAIQARAAGDTARSNHAAGKVTDGLCQFEPVAKTLQNEAARRPDLLIAGQERQERRRRRLIHRGERNDSEAAKQWPSYNEFRDQNELPALLVECWVRQGVNGAPGFMFWRNETMTEFLGLWLDLPQTALPPAEIKKIRQRLGLVPVSKNNHFVWGIHVGTDTKGSRVVEGFQRNGDFAFKGVVPPV